MEFTIGNIVSRTLGVMRERIGPLIGMWALYFGLSIAASVVLGIVLAIVGVAGAGFAGLGADPGPAAIMGLGGGFILTMIITYAAYIYLFAAQAGSLASMGMPYERPAFGEALVRGLKAGLPLLGVALLLLVIYFVGGLLFALVAAGLGSVGEVLGVIMLVLFLPVLIYLACRMSLLVPVAANEQIRNPWRVIVRSWQLSRGNVLTIFLTLLLFTVFALVVMGILVAPFFVSADQGLEAAAIGSMIFMILGFLVASVILSIAQGVLVAVMHGLLSGDTGEELEDIFS